MKAFASVVLMVIVAFAATCFLFNRMNFAMERDDLREQIKLQRREMRFLQNITNSAFARCGMSVATFESIVLNDKQKVLWQGNVALVGPFRVQRMGACIVGIEMVAGL